MISDHYAETVEVQRLTTVSGHKKDYTTHIASVACHVQPFDPEITQDIDIGFGKDYLMFCAVLDIQEGDHVIWDSNEYRIVGIKNFFQFNQEAKHMEIRIRVFQS